MNLSKMREIKIGNFTKMICSFSPSRNRENKELIPIIKNFEINEFIK